MTKHSPLPWSKHSQFSDIMDANGNIILEVPIDCSVEDADLILRACNHQEKLVTALEDLLSLVSNQDGHEEIGRARKVLEEARAA